jgi:dTDP-4-amino-4,6-dideoxygalactose transaminase
MNIPLYNVHMPANVERILADVVTSGQISMGHNNLEFEKLLHRYLGNPLVTVTSDVSNSLVLCLYMAGVRPDDDVLMSPLVCLATSCPVRNLFAHIRWCDVDPSTGNIDPYDISKKITPKTKAIVVYHWAGNPADLDAIHEVARDNNLVVIEDASEAFGAQYHGNRVGATGSNYTVFSFYPNKHLTTIDGGAIACSRVEDHEQVFYLKRYGIHQPTFRYPNGEINPESDIPVAGWNFYMNHVAATIGVAQMGCINWIVSRHQENGFYYDGMLADIPGITLLRKPINSLSAYWVYTFLTRDRDLRLERLQKAGISASRVHLRNDFYTAFGNGLEDLPGVAEFSAHCLSIPCGWWVSDKDRARITDVVCKEFL